MFKYVDFLHFDFRGKNLSNLRHYGVRVQCNNGVARRVSSRPMNTHYKENSIRGKFTCNCTGKYAFQPAIFNVWLKAHSACATTIVVSLLFSRVFNQRDQTERAFLDEPLQRLSDISHLPLPRISRSCAWQSMRDQRIALQALLTQSRS